MAIEIGDTEGGSTLSHNNFVWPVNILRIVTILVPLSILAVVVGQPWVDPKLIFLDPLVAAEIADECCSVAYGFMSQLGIMVWIATSAVCLFCGIAFLLLGERREHIYFALSAGLLSGWLGVDDAFLLHEKVLPTLGVPQTAVLMLYVVLTLFYVATSWRTIFKHDFILLGLGGCGFVMSLFIDIVFHSPVWVHLEDSAKFFGVWCWATFHISSVMRMFVK